MRIPKVEIACLLFFSTLITVTTLFYVGLVTIQNPINPSVFQQYTYPSPFEGFTKWNSYKVGLDTDNIVLQNASYGYLVHPDINHISGEWWVPFVGYYDSTWQTRLANGSEWDGLTEQPGVLIPLGSGGSWDDAGNFGPEYVYNCTGDGQHCLYYAGLDGSNERIGLMKSSDLRTWTKVSNNCAGTSGDGCVFGINASKKNSVKSTIPGLIRNTTTGLVEMLFVCADGSGSSDWDICYANSTNGVDFTQTSGDGVVLTTNATSDWMDQTVGHPRSITYAGGGYHVLFIAKGSHETGTFTSDIGYFSATTLYDKGTYEVYHDNPLVTDERAWEDPTNGEVEDPTTVIVDGTLYMYYSAWISSPPSIGSIEISLDKIT